MMVVGLVEMDLSGYVIEIQELVFSWLLLFSSWFGIIRDFVIEVQILVCTD